MRSGTRRVAVVTGTRAEYGLLQTTMQALRRKSRIHLQLVVAGMHLLRRFGHTVDGIRADGWAIDAVVPMQRGDDSPADQALGLARGVQGIAKFLDGAATDVVVVLGDRIEALAGALAGSSMGRVVAHIHGGDVSEGDLDDSFRHCVTKLAHLHFVATHDAARRVRRLGERPETIHWVGAPGLDRLRELAGEAGCALKSATSALVVQHACGRSPRQEGRVMAAILRAVQSVGLTPTVLYPNSDRGHSGILQIIEEFRSGAGRGGLVVQRSLPRDDYLRLLMRARVLVGNSSSGIIEAATAGTPVVNVGDRQRGRVRGGANVLDAVESFAAIRATLQRALRLKVCRAGRSKYGVGRAGEAIADVLDRVSLSRALRCKQITY